MRDEFRLSPFALSWCLGVPSLPVFLSPSLPVILSAAENLSGRSRVNSAKNLSGRSRAGLVVHFGSGLLAVPSRIPAVCDILTLASEFNRITVRQRRADGNMGPSVASQPAFAPGPQVMLP
jgi:hypothetical protein